MAKKDSLLISLGSFWLPVHILCMCYSNVYYFATCHTIKLLHVITPSSITSMVWAILSFHNISVFVRNGFTFAIEKLVGSPEKIIKCAQSFCLQRLSAKSAGGAVGNTTKTEAKSRQFSHISYKHTFPFALASGNSGAVPKLETAWTVGNTCTLQLACTPADAVCTSCSSMQ